MSWERTAWIRWSTKNSDSNSNSNSNIYFKNKFNGNQCKNNKATDQRRDLACSGQGVFLGSCESIGG